nr:hypothetical protein [Candidatus Sigynarchaeota archaeon]
MPPNPTEGNENPDQPKKKSIFKPMKSRDNGEGALENAMGDWKKIGEKFNTLRKNVNQNIINNLEKLENVHYQNIKSMDAAKQKIEQDWSAFIDEVQKSFDDLKNANEKNKDQIVQDMNVKKAEINEKMKTWEKNYQEWSVKTSKGVKESMNAWSRAGWKLYLSFLVVVIPIVIIIVVLVNAFK